MMTRQMPTEASNEKFGQQRIQCWDRRGQETWNLRGHLIFAGRGGGWGRGGVLWGDLLGTPESVTVRGFTVPACFLRPLLGRLCVHIKKKCKHYDVKVLIFTDCWLV